MSAVQTSSHMSGQPAPTPGGPKRPIPNPVWDDPGKLITAALPWAISLVFHIMVFLLMFLVVWATQEIGAEEDLDFARASLAPAADEPFNPELSGPELEANLEVAPEEASPLQDPQLDLLSEFASSAQEEFSIIGIGADTGRVELPSFGLAGGLGEGPSFFGLGQSELQARKICYVVDRSGSMVDELDYVKEEVIRSINRLHRVQQFHIIFFSGGPPLEAPPQRFVHPIKEYKARAFRFLDGIEARGSTDPVQAMRRAFDRGADMIYFLTDGEFSPELAEKLREWNHKRRVGIYTIAFIRNQGEDLLLRIARENGGEYTFVSEDELY